MTVKWLANSRPPELSFYRIFVSRDDLDWKLRHRPKLNDAEFYDAFYAGSGIPRELPEQLRSRLQLMIGLDLAAMRPSDNLAEADGELDWVDVFYVIEARVQSLDSCANRGTNSTAPSIACSR